MQEDGARRDDGGETERGAPESVVVAADGKGIAVVEIAELVRVVAPSHRNGRETCWRSQGRTEAVEEAGGMEKGREEEWEGERESDVVMVVSKCKV